MTDGLINTLMQILKNLGYKPEVKKIRAYYDISFLSFGFDAFPEAHKNVVRTLAGSRLMEFDYFGCNTQHILIRE